MGNKGHWIMPLWQSPLIVGCELGLVGFFNFNLVSMDFSEHASWVTRIICALVGLCGLI